MAQESKPVFPISRLALIAAALLLAGSLVGSYAFRKDSARAPVAEAGAADALTALEARVAEKPDDAEGWMALGAGYFELGRFADAVRAYEGAVKAAPDKASGWSALGEARVMASEREPMPAAARDAFAKARAIDPKDPRARYFGAVDKDLAGDHQGAIADWIALLRDTPQNAPWERDLRRTIEQVGKINKIDVAAKLAEIDAAPGRQPVAAKAIPGPSKQDLTAASAIPPSQQRDMAEDMTARLEERLKRDPGNIDGWIMLMRSRKTLGQDDKARAALASAIAANPREESRLRAEAGVLGIR